MISAVKSFVYRKTNHAIDGLKVFSHEESSFGGVIALTATLLILGLVFRIPFAEWVIILVACASLWVCEIFNTAIEETVDLFTSEYHYKAKNAKDLGAAACLIAAAVVVFIGIIIFVPRIIGLF